ncbi:subtilase-type protease inhibitor [Streptomyces sp. RB6PN25]|uniref:Subtilase-type protease inhibitor n=1 Tax=Streptomyces humicola TaxID=2953240 RepID=A0ABT1Q3J7_9ACTN|nr:SSI family serine proteinase inhibitor [Streptomyces humicola]MCQ4084495.1 subtilase-type protease inhibitor [Streptomyces humicola]
MFRVPRTPLAAAFAMAVAAAAPAAAAARPVPWDRLVVTVSDDFGTTHHYTLSCRPARGTHPEPRAACHRLGVLRGPIGPVPRDQMCSMIYGGPQTARVTGYWHGVHVDQRYDRVNGCEIDRWRQMEPVLPAPAAAEPVREH